MEKYKDVFEVTDDHIYGFFEDYRFLSNFHVHTIYYEGLLYPSTENAYQAAKYSDEFVKRKFTTISPADAKKLSRELTLPPAEIAIFDAKKLRIMYEVNMLKYTDYELRKMLLSTGERYLEETNYWGDRFWGYCHGKGDNHLGLILMDLRKFYACVEDSIKGDNQNESPFKEFYKYMGL